MKYTPLAVEQNRANAIRVCVNFWPLERTPAAPGAAKTRMFFIHCRGLAVAISDRRKLRSGASGSGISLSSGASTVL